MRQFLIILLLVCSTLNFAQGTYYDNISISKNTFVEDLKNRIRNPYYWVPYSQHDETNIANFASQDNGNGTRSVFCVYSNYEHIYTGTFAWLPLSREHTFPHSWMPTNPADSPIERDEYADQHHLFPAHQDNANAVRSNYPLGNVTNVTNNFLEAKFGTDFNGKFVYEPRDQHKGDAARAILYMIIRYDGIDGYDWGLTAVNAGSGRVQDLDVLLDWHYADPPDQWEIARNDYTESIQGNRNPFVDHPEYVEFIDFNEVEYLGKDLFISEYVEGSSNNKAIEIYNNTGSTIDLSGLDYKIEINLNETTIVTKASLNETAINTVINLSGSILDGDVFVLYHSGSDAAISSVGDQSTADLIFDGNDAIILKKGTEILDVIGQVDFDPGTEWGTGNVSTSDNTIRRKSSIGKGDADGSDAFDPNDEWNGFALDTFDGLGLHTVNAGPPTISAVSRTPKIPTQVENTIITADVTDDGALGLVKIKFTIDGGSEQEAPMTNTTGDEYSGSIPSSAYIDGSLLECWVYAEDAEGSPTNSSKQKVFIGITPIAKLHPVNADGGLLHANTYARILGVATVGSGTFSTSSLDVNLQDASGGITIYKSGAFSTTILKGNNYKVEGKLEQYNGKTEIVPDVPISDVVNLGVGTLPEPLLLKVSELLINPEAYEGMLIKINQLSNINPGSGWPTSGNNANIMITDNGGTTTLTLRIDKETNIDGSEEPDWPIDIIGVLTQFDSAPPYNWGYQIQPRSLDDFSNSVVAELKIFLEGPYNSYTDEMFSTINNLVPKISPFSENPRSIIEIPENIVDWVLVELRKTFDGPAVSSHSALLHKDGRIVADNGVTSTIRIPGNPGSYFIVVKHRNHLPIMSEQAIYLTAN